MHSGASCTYLHTDLVMPRLEADRPCWHRPGAPALEPQLQPQAAAEARTALPFAERELSFPSLNIASQARCDPCSALPSA